MTEYWYECFYKSSLDYWYVDKRTTDGGETVLVGFKDHRYAQEAVDYLNSVDPNSIDHEEHDYNG